jgi:hypothetical protein
MTKQGSLIFRALPQLPHIQHSLADGETSVHSCLISWSIVSDNKELRQLKLTSASLEKHSSRRNKQYLRETQS